MGTSRTLMRVVFKFTIQGFVPFLFLFFPLIFYFCITKIEKRLHNVVAHSVPLNSSCVKTEDLSRATSYCLESFTVECSYCLALKKWFTEFIV